MTDKPKKQPNAEVGRCNCAFCGREASVRRNSAGKLYYLCGPAADGHQGCGMITPNLRAGQAWMEANTRAASAPAAPPVTETPPAEPAAPPVNVTEEKAPAPGLFSALLNTRIL